MIQLIASYTYCGIYLSLGYGDIRILGDGDSGELLFEEYEYNWNTVCVTGFGDNAGDVACRHLGYQRSTDVYTYAEYVILAICSEIATAWQEILVEKKFGKFTLLFQLFMKKWWTYRLAKKG